MRFGYVSLKIKAYTAEALVTLFITFVISVAVSFAVSFRTCKVTTQGLVLEIAHLRWL